MISNNYYNFFLIIPPGFKNLAKKELFEKTERPNGFNFSIVKEEIGGIEINCALHDGLSLNYYLKIPTRILLRISNFKCRDFPKLFKKISKLNWSDYLNGPDIKVQASSARSRLINTSRVEETIIDGIKKFFISNTPSKKMLEKKISFTPNIFIRIIDDVATVSIDTTGDRLNIRSYKTLTTDAPIRENLASALTYALFENDITNLIDPMCGSGTFLLEAMSFYHKSNRSFSFESFNLVNHPILQKSQMNHSPFRSYYGFDISDKNILASKQNFKNLSLDNKIMFKQEDLFSDKLTNITGPNTVVINPPYGRRIKIEGKLSKYFQNLFCQIVSKFQPKKIGIILPENITYKNINFDHYKINDVIKFKNGGIKVVYIILKLNQ